MCLIYNYLFNSKKYEDGDECSMFTFLNTLNNKCLLIFTKCLVQIPKIKEG